MTTEPTNSKYEHQRMAGVIAEIVSGIKGAIPEQDDFDMAQKLIDIIDGEAAL